VIIIVIFCKVIKVTDYISSSRLDTSICGHVGTSAHTYAHAHTHTYDQLQMNGKCQN